MSDDGSGMLQTTVSVPADLKGSGTEIICKATDAAYNTQVSGLGCRVSRLEFRIWDLGAEICCSGTDA